jgi:hypothetical protein
MPAQEQGIIEPDAAITGSGIARLLSLLGLAAAGVVLLYAIWLAGTYTFTHSGPPCPNPPHRDSNPTQLVVVAICLVTFVLGHLSARWGEVNRRALRPNLEPAEDDVRARPEESKRKRDALSVQALLLVFLLEIVGLLIIEASTLSNGVWPITYYVRCSYDAAGWPSTAAAAAILFLVGRWFWLTPRKGDARSSS